MVEMQGITTVSYNRFRYLCAAARSIRLARKMVRLDFLNSRDKISTQPATQAMELTKLLVNSTVGIGRGVSASSNSKSSLASYGDLLLAISRSFTVSENELASSVLGRLGLAFSIRSLSLLAAWIS